MNAPDTKKKKANGHKPPPLPYHELFELPEGTSPEDFQPIAPGDIKIGVTRYDTDGATRAHRKYSGAELTNLERLHAMFGRGYYELEARRVDGTFYARRTFKIEGDPPRPLNPPTDHQANGLPAVPIVPGMPQPATLAPADAGAFTGGPFQMMMVMMQNLFGMMMAQQQNSTTLLAAVLGKQQQGTDPAVAAALASVTELAKTRLEVTASQSTPSTPATPEQEIARMQAMIDLAKKLSPTTPPETITQQIKELWPIVGPTVGPIFQQIAAAGARAAVVSPPVAPPPGAPAQPLPGGAG
jgi:hypothetical protein